MDYPMKSMKVQREEKPMSTDAGLMSSGPEYPYGLRITLAHEILKKMDLTKLPEVGSRMGLHAIVEVVGVNADRAMNGGKETRVELQITDMCLKTEADDSMAKVKESNDEEYDEDETILGKG